VNENRPVLSSFSASPLDSRFNLSRLRCPGIPSWKTQIRMPFKLFLSWKLTSTIYNSRITRWQFINGIRPPTNINTLTNLIIRLLPTSKPA
jgi:hypothetical protein